MVAISVQPPRLKLLSLPAVSASPVSSQPNAGHDSRPVAGHDAGFASGGGGGIGGFLSGIIHKIFNPRTLIFAGLGAVAATAIPPLAFLGGPIGGAVAGALLSMIL